MFNTDLYLESVKSILIQEELIVTPCTYYKLLLGSKIYRILNPVLDKILAIYTPYSRMDGLKTILFTLNNCTYPYSQYMEVLPRPGSSLSKAILLTPTHSLLHIEVVK